MHHDLEVEVRDAYAVARLPSLKQSRETRYQHSLQLDIQLMSM
jgi:hypothetical protein